MLIKYYSGWLGGQAVGSDGVLTELGKKLEPVLVQVWTNRANNIFCYVGWLDNVEV